MSAPLVIKLGGSSLASAARIRLAARRIATHRARGTPVVAVVSARGRSTDRITRLLARVSSAGRPAPREADRALSTGEDLAAALLASALCSLGVQARSLRGGEAGVAAEGGFCGGAPLEVDPAPLRALLAAGTVPVVSGFQGQRADGETVTLGRGASDLSAVVIAAALGAGACHLVTDVAGIFDADPRRAPAARLLPRLSHAELLELAAGGARVVQRDAAAAALRQGVELFIYHYRAVPGSEAGTRVSAREPARDAAACAPAPRGEVRVCQLAREVAA